MTGVLTDLTEVVTPRYGPLSNHHVVPLALTQWDMPPESQ